MAFDAGGVTTGPVTVPFIMALGVGMAAVFGRGGAKEDSFGLVALCSVGPIFMVLLLGIVYHPAGAAANTFVPQEVFNTQDVARQFVQQAPLFLKEVLFALAPVVVAFVAFQLYCRCLPRRKLVQAGVGVLYTLVGLVLFLTGVNVGFMPAGQYLGSALASSAAPWLLLPVGFVVGWFIVTAEPAVHVLTVQVEEVSGGAISRRAMLRGLSVGGVALRYAGHGAGADRAFDFLVFGARLSVGAGAVVFCATHFYRYCV